METSGNRAVLRWFVPGACAAALACESWRHGGALPPGAAGILLGAAAVLAAWCCREALAFRGARRKLDEERAAERNGRDDRGPVGRELAQRMRAEARLQVTEQHLRLALEGADAYFWDWDLDASLLDVDLRWAQAFGCASDELQAAPDEVPGFFACAEDAPHVRELFAACRSGAAESLASKHRVRTASGQVRWVRMRAKVVERRPDGTPTRIAGTIADITDRRKLRERLEHAERLASIGTMAGSMAHELNSPLACVLANVEYAARGLEAAPAAVRAAWASCDPGGLEDLGEALREADQGARRVREIVRGLKRFVGGQAPRGNRTGLQRALAQAIESAREELARCAEVVSDVPETLFAEASESDLVQVFTALLVNAGQATDAVPNRVRISATLAGSGLVAIEISDTGAGIAPEALPRIFDPFFTTKGLSGRGLGLSTSLAIAKSLGGDVEVESAVGAGSRFRVLLPGSSSAGPEAPGQTPRTTSAS